MFRIALFAVVAAAAFAQDAPKPPAGVDEALRARVKEFYQYHVTEEYRKAEKLVAEDSQDVYYIHNKPHYFAFEIQTVEYLDNFTKAKVSVLCEQTMNGIGFMGQKMKTPSTSTWKVVDGKWYWYADPASLAQGPMGVSANAGTKATGVTPPDINKPVDLGRVTADKESVDAKPNSTQEVTFTNSTTGNVSIVLHQRLPGWTITIDKANLHPGEKAVATFKTDDNPHGGEISFMVGPFGNVITLQSKR